MKIPKSLTTINLDRVLRKQGWIEKQKAWIEMRDDAKPLARKLLDSRKKAVDKPRHQQFTNDEVMAYWEKQIHIVDTLEKKFDTKVQQFISKVVDGFLAHLESEIAVNKSLAKTKDYFDDNEDDLLIQAQLDFTPLLSDVATLAGQEALDLIKSRDVYSTEQIRVKIAENVAKFTRSMLDTDRQTLVDIITNGLTNGESIPEIRGQIVAKFDAIQKSQAQRITRTEVLRASNQASIDAYRQSDVVEGLQWLTAGAVDECADYEGQIVALDDTFYGGETEFDDGYPPLHPNCRCVVLPVLIGEKGFVSDTKALRQRVVELESQIDKRTKAYREIKGAKIDDELKIQRLQAVIDEQTKAMLNKDKEDQ